MIAATKVNNIQIVQSYSEIEKHHLKVVYFRIIEKTFDLRLAKAKQSGSMWCTLVPYFRLMTT